MCKQYKRLGISLKVKGSKRAFEIWTSDWIKHPWVAWVRWLGKPSILLLYCVWQPAIIVLAIHNCCAYLDYNVPLCSLSSEKKKERRRRRLGMTQKTTYHEEQSSFKKIYQKKVIQILEITSKAQKKRISLSFLHMNDNKTVDDNLQLEIIQKWSSTHISFFTWKKSCYSRFPLLLLLA